MKRTRYVVYWLVMDESNREVTRYSTNDIIDYSGAVDTKELKVQVRTDLGLTRADRVIIAD